MRRVLAVVMIALPLAGAGEAHAQSAPSEMQQRFACMGDAVRLCPQYIPNREAIRNCMAAQHARLSDGCRPTFDASMRALGLKIPR